MASIQGIYLAFFGRPADPLGLAYWEEQTNGGADLSVMLDALSGTAEYQDRFVGMNNEEVIQSIYQALFGRDAEPEGLAHFLEALANGTQTLGSIAVNILDGAQGSDLAMIENKIAAAELFTASLDTEAEIAAYSGNEAADFGRQFLSTVTEDPETVPTAETVQEQINTDLPNYVPDEVAPPAPGGGGGTGPAPTPDPEDVFLARWKALDKQYYDFAARDETGPGLNEDINNSFINLANDYVAYLNTGKAAIVDVIQQKVLVDGVYVDDNNRAQTFHDNVLGNINSDVLKSSRPKKVDLVSEAAKKFADRPLADGKTDSSLDENAAWSWDFANGIPSGKLPFDRTVILATGNETAGLGDVKTSVKTSVIEAVAAAESGDVIHVLPGSHTGQVKLTANQDLVLQGVAGATVDSGSAPYGINATGAAFGGTVTIDGFTVVAGTEGGIGQFMSASNGKFIVTNNVIAVSDKSYSAHGNGIQISGQGSVVAYNTIDATPYSGLNNSWSTSGITVVKSASGSTVHDNVIQLSENKALGVGQSAIGIGVDGYYGAMTDINISANIISSLSSGISLSEEIEVKVEGNTLIGNKQGISLGYQDNHTSGDRWFDKFDITISNNIFEESKLADIAFFDFDAGSVHIGDNIYSGTVPALWFDEAGTYGDAENLALLSIDITKFITGSKLSDNVFVSSADGFADIQLTSRVTATDDWVVTGADESGFEYLQITLVGSGSFNDVEVLGLFGITPDLV